MKKLISAILLFSLFCIEHSLAANTHSLPNLDRTCKSCTRIHNDSVNVFNRRPIRLNQSGFKPEHYKYAYVADPTEKTFKIIDANSGKEVPGGGNLTLIGKVVRPGITVRVSFNSTQDLTRLGDSTSTGSETLYRADFTTLTTVGEYFLVVGKDTSATFHISPYIYNAILEKSMMFFGIQRCGNTDSHFHGACHLKDGSRVNHDLTGGWHDCGDHFKVGETVGYAAYVLSMVYLTYPNKAEDRFGHSYADTIPDGVPDILYEAKIGADYIMKLYDASVADGLIEKGDMYHTVGMSDWDHSFWDVPEHQDMQSTTKGGPDRLVLKGIGTNVAGIYTATLANVAAGFKWINPSYSQKLLDAAKTIYAKIVKPTYLKYTESYEGRDKCAKRGKATLYEYNEGNITFNGKGYYSGMGLCEDDAAAAAVSLWYATGDTTYSYDLYKNPEMNTNGIAKYDLAFFPKGILAMDQGFNNSWATDYQNLFAYVLFAMQKLILNDPEFETKFNISQAERDSLSMRVMAAFRKQVETNSTGDSIAVLYEGNTSVEPREGTSKLKVNPPYNLVWTSFDWGVMRYNMGSAVAVFLLYELTKDERYLKVALDNMYYVLGANPWDISLLLGAGDKNPQHPHNRSANPDGYNAGGGIPYDYKCPIGALMGGRAPNLPLIEDWEKYTSTETCIDFSAQFLFPAQSLAEQLPPDNDGPVFSDVVGIPTSDSTAIISWKTDELALVTVSYDATTNANTAKSIQLTEAVKEGSVTLTGLTPGQTYYFFLEGVDPHGNITTDDNHGYWYKFTMTSTATQIKGVTICQVDNRSAKIYWWSTDRLDGMVHFGKTKGSYTEKVVANGGVALFHEAVLTGLEAGTTYYFTVSSGATTSEEYSFTTEQYATTVDMDINVKPLNKDGCRNSSDWTKCNTFLVIVRNKDSVEYNDLDLRFYFPVAVQGSSNNKSIWDGTGFSVGWPVINFGEPVAYNVTSMKDSVETGYYMPVHIEGKLAVSGSYFFELIINPTYGSIKNSWSFRPHTAADDPEYFEGINLERGPLYKEESNSNMYVEIINGVGEKAFRKTAYVTAYYHGTYIYGYGPDYTPDKGPQVDRKIETTFSSPFISPIHSVEKVDPVTTYSASSTITPNGFLDAVEMNSDPYSFDYINPKRTDAITFGGDTTLAYGNNYMEWVTWHNRNANQKSENKYDCACGVVRTNVEIDSITKPLEKRYLVFDKSNIVGYKDKYIEVQISLLDSSLTLLKDEKNLNVELVSDDPNVQFYTDPTATIPVTTVTLFDGVATIYVSSKVAVKTNISATHERTKDIDYVPATAELNIEELPPWPIIDAAKIVDLDCDHIPDAMDITLSSEYTENQKFTSIKFTYDGKEYTSSTVKSLNGRSLVVNIDVPKNVVTNATGKITLISNIQGQSKEVEDSYSDGMPPALLSATILERQDTSTTDHLYLQFSEPISAPGTNFPLVLYSSDKTTKATIPTVTSAKLYNEEKNIWHFEIAFDAGGNSLVSAGMWGQLDVAGTIMDLNGNGVAGACTPDKVEIFLKILPIPMTYAVITDKLQNGYASHVDITFAKALDEKHTPDKLELIFGVAYPETLTVEKGMFTFNGATLSIDLNPTFKFGNTAGTFEGTLPGGKALTNAGLVTQYLGTGAATETNSVLAEDKVGPVYVSATINQTSTNDILTIIASEPLVTADSAQQYYRHKRAEKQSNAFSSSFSSWSYGQNKSGVIFIFSGELTGTVMEGDFVRMGSMMTSTFKDANGNYPEFEVPWIPVDGKGAPSIKFDVALRENVTDANSNKRTKVDVGETMRFYIKNPSSNKFDLIQNGKVTMAGIDSSDIGGAIFDAKLTVPRGASFGEECAWEKLLVKFNIPIYSNLGHFVNRFHQSFEVDPKLYLSPNNQIYFAIEWANKAPSGIRSKEDRAVGTGAYIYKAEIETRFSPNMNNPEVRNDSKITQNFSSKNTFERTKVFGIKRTK